MRILYISLFCLAFSFTANAQSKEEQKQLREQEKQAQKAREAVEKARLKRPAQVVVNAAPDRIKAIIVKGYAQDGWQLEQEGTYRLVFQRDPQGFWQRFGLGMAYGGSAGNPPRPQLAFTLAPSNQGVLVVVDLSVVAQRFGGTTSRYNWNEDKKARADIEWALQKIKQVAEAENTNTATTNPKVEAVPVAPVPVQPITSSPKPTATAPVTSNPKVCYRNLVEIPCPKG